METNMTNTSSQCSNLPAHPDVVRAIEGTLCNYGVCRQDLEDAVAEVQTRALEYVQGRQPPCDVAGWTALCVTIAQHWRTDENEKQEYRAQYDEGPTDEADQRTPLEHGAPARDPIDTQRLLEVLAGLFRAGEMPEHGLDILDCKQAGMTYREIGEELGLSRSVVRWRMHVMRKRFLRKLALLGMMVTLILLALLAARSTQVADRGEITAPSAEVQVPPPRMEPGGEEIVSRAKALRAQAERDCSARRWLECLAGLDGARREDPSGDEAPEVKALRDKAVKALAEGNSEEMKEQK
jgi:DNA-directed RNA polymerase specialized sigma24 family protein